MSSILVTHGTGNGQTAKVADRLATVIAGQGHDITIRPVDDVSPADVRAADAILVGSPVQNRRFLPAVVDFVRANSEALMERPSAFFQLSLAVLFPFRWARDGDHRWIDTLVEETGWEPDLVGRFAGAVSYTQYDVPTRWVFKFVSLLTTGDTDTSRDYEYTDWDAVEQFGVEVAEMVDREVGEGRRFPDLRAAAVGAIGLGIGATAYWIATRRRRSAEPVAAEGEPRGETPEPVSG